jgi:uncharacterized protein
MAGQKGRIAHCYRCIYTWRIRARVRPAICPRCKSRLYANPKIRPVIVGHGLGIEDVIHPHREAVLRAAQRHGVQRLWVFGSVRRQEANARSDVDLMVRWNGPHSLLDRVRLASELSTILGRNVDLVNEGGLHWAVEPQVESERVPL